jgi:WD40 repeat protein
MSTRRTDFVLTTSVDGHLKFWKKQEQGIEFVKHYRTSLKAVVGVSASEDGVMYATISEDGQGRVFDVVNFGMSHSPTVDPKTQNPERHFRSHSTSAPALLASVVPKLV